MTVKKCFVFSKEFIPLGKEATSIERIGKVDIFQGLPEYGLEPSFRQTNLIIIGGRDG